MKAIEHDGRIRHVDYEKRYIMETYHTRICHWCRRPLANGEKTYHPMSESTVILCEGCKDNITNPPDFNPEGSKQKGTTSWKTANTLTLIRDFCHCRVCGEHYSRENPVEVHHIIPKKDGGTHHLKNLVTLCEKHHRETFRNNYAGLKITDRFIAIGIQKTLKEGR